MFNSLNERRNKGFVQTNDLKEKLEIIFWENIARVVNYYLWSFSLLSFQKEI